MTEVTIGQKWADNDLRAAGRAVLVVNIAMGYATCVVVSDRSDPRPRRGKWNFARAPEWSAIGQTTRIRLDRFAPTSTGYRLLNNEGDTMVNHPSRGRKTGISLSVPQIQVLRSVIASHIPQRVEHKGMDAILRQVATLLDQAYDDLTRGDQ